VKFKLDEYLPAFVREAFGEMGHDAHSVAEEGLSGAFDENVLAACIAVKRVRIRDGGA